MKSLAVVIIILAILSLMILAWVDWRIAVGFFIGITANNMSNKYFPIK